MAHFDSAHLACARHIPMSGCPPRQWPSGQNCSPSHLALAKSGNRQVRTGRFSRRAFVRRRSMLHRASVRRLFRHSRHQTAAEHKCHQDGKKESQFQIVHHAFLRVGEGRHGQGAGTPIPFASTTQPSCWGSACGYELPPSDADCQLLRGRGLINAQAMSAAGRSLECSCWNSGSHLSWRVFPS
jgi:hypothetical protein